MKKILIAFREGSENGGPYNSHLRIMNSELNKKYLFVPLYVPKGKMGLTNYRLLRTLINQIKNERPDAVQIIGLELIGFYLALACRICRVKRVVVAVHGSTTEAIEFNKNPIKSWIMQRLEVFTLKTGTVVYGVSEYVYSIKNIAKYSRNYYGSIYNMLLNDKNNYNRVDLRKELGIPDDSLVVITTGRVIREKGFDILVSIIKNYQDDLHIVFVIAGDGNYRNTMEKELSEQINSHQVFFLGYRNDVSRILSGGDLFVMPSYHETLCMSLIEAGQKGLAMIASDVGGMKEVISHGETGYLAETGNPDSFINYIDILKRNPVLLASMKKRAYESIINKFSNDVTIKKLDDLYSQLLNS